MVRKSGDSKVTFYYIAAIILTDKLSENSEIRYLDSERNILWHSFVRDKSKALAMTTYNQAWNNLMSAYANNKNQLHDMSFFIYAESREHTKDLLEDSDKIDPVASFLKSRNT